MSKVGEYYRELEEMGINQREIDRVRKAIKKAADERAKQSKKKKEKE